LCCVSTRIQLSKEAALDIESSAVIEHGHKFNLLNPALKQFSFLRPVLSNSEMHRTLQQNLPTASALTEA
jgi:hypothetical protein